MVNADNEFKKIEEDISVPLEICGAGQHIPRIKQAVCTIKERTRCFWVPLTYHKVPKLMVDECLTMVVTCLNNFPHKNGISPTPSPASIVLGRGKVDTSILKATFGRYYEVYQGTDNTNKERRISAICLHPSNNKGVYYFMSTESGKRIHGYNFVELSMPQSIIDHVHELADREHAPDLDVDGCPIFEWELGHPIFDLPPPPAPTANLSYDDDSYHPDSDSDDDLLSKDYSEKDDTSISDHDNASTAHTPQQEARSATPDPITIDDNDADDTDNNDHTNTIDASVIDNDDVNKDDEVSADELRQAIEEKRREIDPENIINTRRQRKPSSQPNISSLGGKKYHPNFLNLDNEKFTNIE